MDLKKRRKRILKEFFFFLIWTIVFTKFFIIDVEAAFFQEYLPEHTDLLKYRVFVYLLLTVILWYVLKTKRFFKNTVFLIGYPLYFLFWTLPKQTFWKIPKYLLVKKQWLFLYTYINSIINRLIEFKLNLLKGVLLVFAIILTFRFQNPIVLYIALAINLILLLLLIYKRISISLRPISLFRLNLEFLKSIRKDKNFFISNLQKMQSRSDEEDEKKAEKKRKEDLEQIIVTRSFVSLIAFRLDDFLNRKTYVFLFLIQVLMTFIGAWFLLSLMNFSAFKIDSTNYNLTIEPKLFDFIYYTFHSMLLGSVNDIIAANILAKALDILAPFASILITGTIITLFLSVRSEQYKESLNEIIEFSQSSLLSIEELLIDSHEISYMEALEYLRSKESTTCKIVDEIEKFNRLP